MRDFVVDFEGWVELLALTEQIACEAARTALRDEFNPLREAGIEVTWTLNGSDVESGDRFGTLYAVDFKGQVRVHAPNNDAAFTKAFNLLNDALSPLMEGGMGGDWELTEVASLAA